MKRKLTLVVCVIALFALIFTLASCGGGNDDDKHTHTYAQEWSTSDVAHWYQATCGCEGEISNYGAHIDKNKDGACDTCKYVICTHKYESAWQTDAENHWKNPTCGCNVIGEKGQHTDANKDGNCDTCAYVMCAHTYADVLSSDKTNHWYAATCGCEVAGKGLAAHVDAVLDGKCDVCAYVVCAHVDANKDGNCDDCDFVVCAHTYADAWSSDKDNHWHAPTCQCSVANKDVAPHADENKDGNCDTCAYVMCTHEFASEWSKDGAYHWYAATCGCNVVDKKAEHVDEPKDGICDVCGGEVCEHTFDTKWTSDKTGHWYASTCGCAITDKFAAHVDEGKDGICDVCSYVVCAHEYAKEWSSDKDNHWKKPTCGCSIDNIALAAHVDENKDGICDICEYVKCTHEFAPEWSSDENTHWHAATCGCNVKADEGSHDDGQVCSVCGRDSLIKNTIGNLNSEASLGTNSTVSVKNEGTEFERESSYKLYDNYVVIKDDFGNTRYYSYYGEDNEFIFAINIGEDGITRFLDVEEFGNISNALSYSMVYGNASANNNEDIIKALYKLGVEGSKNWEDTQVGFSYGFNGAKKDEAFTFSYVYTEEGTFYLVEVSFTVDTTVNGITAANISVKQYGEGSVTVDELTDTYVIADNAVEITSDTYKITQTFGEAMDSKDNPNPYVAKDYIINESFTLTDGENVYNDGDTINIYAGEGLALNFNQEIADIIKFNRISIIATNSEGEELSDWSTIGTVSIDGFSDLRTITFVGNVEDTYTVSIDVEGFEMELTINVTYKAPDEIYSVVYDAFNDVNETVDNWTMYFGQELIVKAIAPIGCNPEFTAALGANEFAVLKANDDGTYTFKPVAVGEYEIVFTSTVNTEAKTTLNISVIEVPSIDDILTGEYTTSGVYNVAVSFNGDKVTIKIEGVDQNADSFDYTATYTYSYNAETGAVELTYVSGDEFEVELALVNYELVLTYDYREITFKDEEAPEIPTDATESPFYVTTTDNNLAIIEDWDKFIFVAGAAGNYTFIVPHEFVEQYAGMEFYSNAVGLAFPGQARPEVDYQGLQEKYSATIYLAEGEAIVLSFCGTVKGTFEITFTYEAAEAPEEPTVKPGLAGTYTAEDDYGNSFPVTITDSTITFQPPMSQIREWTYTVDENGNVTIYIDGEAVTNTLVAYAVIDTENDVFVALGFNGYNYGLTKQASTEPEEPEEPTSIIGTYVGTDSWENTIDVIIDETTVTFSFYNPRLDAYMTDVYEYTVADGIMTLTRDGAAVAEMQASVTLTDGVPTAATLNGTNYTLALAGTDEPEEPEEPDSIIGTYVGTDSWENTIDVIIDETTVTFSFYNPRLDAYMTDVYEYTVADGIMTLTRDGEAVAEMQASVTLTDGVPTAAMLNGTAYTLTPAGTEEPDSIIGTYVGTDNWGGTIDVIIDETTVTFSFYNPRLGGYVTDVYEYTVSDGIMTLTRDGEAVAEMQASVTLTDGVPTAATLNGTAYTLALAGTDEPEEPEEPSDNELVLGENEVPVTGDNSQMTEVTFTATEAGEYTFSAGEGVVIEYTDGYTLEYESVTFTLEAGETITLYVNNMYYTAGTGIVTVSYEAADDGEDDEATLVIGSNTIDYTAADIEAGAKQYTFYALVNGQYTFASNDVGARVFENGMMLGMGNVHLEAGKTYTVAVFAMAEGTYTLNITAVEDQIGGDEGDEETGTEENPTVWDEIPSEVTINSDTMNKIYFTFTATQDGYLVITYPIEDDSWSDLYEIIDGMPNGQNSQGSNYESVSRFAIEAGKTYRLGLGTYWTPGEFTLQISFSDEEISGGDEPEEPDVPVDPQEELKALLSNYTYQIGEYKVALTQDFETGVYYIEVTDESWTIDLCFTYSVTDNEDGTFTLNDLEHYEVAWEAGFDSVDTVTTAVEGQTISANLLNNLVLGEHVLNGYVVVLSREEGTGKYIANICDESWSVVDLYFTYEAVDNGDGTISLALTYEYAFVGEENLDAILSMDWTIGEVEGDDEEEPEEGDPFKDSLYGFYSTGSYELFFLNSEGTYLANVYGDGFDMYFTYEVIDNGDGTYSVTMTYFARPGIENYNEDKLVAIEATVFSLTKNEEDVWVFTDGTESDEEEEPTEDVIDNSLLNGTWQLADPMTGEVGAVFVFEDGIITVTDYTGGQLNLNNAYDYEYNVTQGVITVDGNDTNMFTLDMGGNLVYGFHHTLTKV